METWGNLEPFLGSSVTLWLCKAWQKVLLSGVTPYIQKQFAAADEASRALN